MATPRWNSFAPDTPTWQIVARCIAGGVLAGVIFTVLGAITGFTTVIGGIFFTVIFGGFLTVTNLRQMQRGPWAPD